MIILISACGFFPDAHQITNAHLEAGTITEESSEGAWVFTITNPNDDTPFVFTSYKYTLSAGETDLGKHRYEQAVPIPPGESVEIRIPVTVTAQQRPADAAESLSLTASGTLWLDVGEHSVVDEALTLSGQLPLKVAPASPAAGSDPR